MRWHFLHCQTGPNYTIGLASTVAQLCRHLIGFPAALIRQMFRREAAVSINNRQLCTAFCTIWRADQ